MNIRNKTAAWLCQFFTCRNGARNSQQKQENSKIKLIEDWNLNLKKIVTIWQFFLDLKMYIKSMVVDGFKSYGQRTEINGFDHEFNAITGLNGSGKSNILDAICFLLGITNLSHVSLSFWYTYSLDR